MKCKYKKFLKAAYIDYEEDYCSNAVLRKTRPSQEEILAPATFEITSDMLDAIDDGYYWFTFYTSMANYQAPDGVLVQKVNLNGTQFIRLDIEDGIINKGQGVVLRSSTDSITLTKTYSKSSDDYSNNSLIGTDYQITNPGNAYRLYDVPLKGLGFYPVISTGKIKANKAYLIMPITYLTQWQIVGNSQVHTDPYLTSWKISGNSQIQQYLTQWKVKGNSVVDNNTILSCGDLGQDGYYHVKISNGVDVFDIALNEPLRKVNNVADTIEFPSSTEGKALVTRNLGNEPNLGSLIWSASVDESTGSVRFMTNRPSNYKKPGSELANMLCAIYETQRPYNVSIGTEGIALSNSVLSIHDDDYNANDSETNASFTAHLNGVELIYELATPTTELVDAPQISVSQTNTYSSANTTPYSAFTYAAPLIYSCGDYSDVDGKYHVKISNGVTIYDIPLTEPLRKVNDIADIIEFPSNTDGKALVTRNIASAILSNLSWTLSRYSYFCLNSTLPIKPISDNNTIPNITVESFTTYAYNNLNEKSYGCSFSSGNNVLCLNDDSFYEGNEITQEFMDYIAGKKIIYELATPTTELIDISPFPVSATDTYTSANVTPYSAFEHTENKEIWSCGEYNATDGKYHIRVQPLGGSIADIALDEPLRKVNDVADTIDLMYGTIDLVMIRRRLASFSTDRLEVWKVAQDRVSGQYFCYTTFICTNGVKYPSTTLPNLLCNKINTVVTWREGPSYNGECIMVSGNRICVKNATIEGTVESYQSYLDSLGAIEIIYPLATLTQELVILSPIEEADSYSCVISQGGKAVSWSNFETE